MAWGRHRLSLAIVVRDYLEAKSVPGSFPLGNHRMVSWFSSWVFSFVVGFRLFGLYLALFGLFFDYDSNFENYVFYCLEVCGGTAISLRLDCLSLLIRASKNRFSLPYRLRASFAFILELD